jgi:Tfp pilus assembly ATPase PilU
MPNTIAILKRGYVEFRGNNGDGGEIVIAAILSFRSKSKLSKQAIKQEIVRKARYALKRAATAT